MQRPAPSGESGVGGNRRGLADAWADAEFSSFQPGRRLAALGRCRQGAGRAPGKGRCRFAIGHPCTFSVDPI